MSRVIPSNSDPQGRDAFAKAIRAIHAAGPRDELAKYFAPPQPALSSSTQATLGKLAVLGVTIRKGPPLPPQSDNAQNDSTTADDGASTRTQFEPVPRRAAPFLGPRQSASIQQSSAPCKGGEQEDASISAIKQALAVPRTFMPSG